jgi:hypothetical protein
MNDPSEGGSGQSSGAERTGSATCLKCERLLCGDSISPVQSRTHNISTCETARQKTRVDSGGITRGAQQEPACRTDLLGARTAGPRLQRERNRVAATPLYQTVCRRPPVLPHSNKSLPRLYQTRGRRDVSTWVWAAAHTCASAAWRACVNDNVAHYSSVRDVCMRWTKCKLRVYGRARGAGWKAQGVNGVRAFVASVQKWVEPVPFLQSDRGFARPRGVFDRGTALVLSSVAPRPQLNTFLSLSLSKLGCSKLGRTYTLICVLVRLDFFSNFRVFLARVAAGPQSHGCASAAGGDGAQHGHHRHNHNHNHNHSTSTSCCGCCCCCAKYFSTQCPTRQSIFRVSPHPLPSTTVRHTHTQDTPATVSPLNTQSQAPSCTHAVAFSSLQSFFVCHVRHTRVTTHAHTHTNKNLPNFHPPKSESGKKGRGRLCTRLLSDVTTTCATLLAPSHEVAYYVARLGSMQCVCV